MIIVKKTMKYVIIIALVSYILTYLFKFNTGIIQKYEVYGITQYRFSIKDYLVNLSNFNTYTNISITTIIPSRTWTDPGSNWISDQFWEAIINNIAYIFDWLYFPLNIILYVIRLAVYVVRLLLAVIGWPLSTHIQLSTSCGIGQPYCYEVVFDSQLMQALTWITNKLIIPYV